ncbi:MAG: hypothetical protein JRJ59_11980, partial [Deltaproteobacteria bacterium]|nr:hypothetical protein [Deltaproteobacteria bacterium]
MKLGVIIDRINYYRYLGPIVEAALGRGWEVICWHFEGGPQQGGKANQRPSANPAPTYLSGRPRIVDFFDFQELSGLTSGVEATVTLLGPLAYGIEPRSKWGTIQHGFDSFQSGWEHLLSADLNFIYSDYW